VILAYSGIWAGAGSNIDTSTTATANASPTDATAAGTANYAQDMILALYGTAGDSSFTTPAGMTVRGAVVSQSGAPATRSSSGSFDVIQAALGAIAAKSSTITNRDNTAIMVAIRPAATAASAGLSTLTASPKSVAADGSTTSTLTATIKDTNGNPLPGKKVTLAKGSGSSAIVTVSGTTSAAGVATFTVTDAAVESTVYTATDTTDSAVVTQTATVSFTAGPVAAPTSTVTTSPGSVTANGSTASVTAKDAFGHLLSGLTVSLGQSDGSSSISPASTSTNGSGVATFSVTDTTAQTVTYTATIGATSVTQTAQVIFTPGAATHLGVTGPASATAGVSFATLSVTALDAFGNTATGYTGTAHFTGGALAARLPERFRAARVRRARENEQQVTEPVQIDERERVHGPLVVRGQNLTLGPAALGARDVQAAGSFRTAGKDEAAELGKGRVRGVAVTFEPVDRRLVDAQLPVTRGIRHREVGAEIEELVLNPFELGRHGRDSRPAEDGVQFVDRAVSTHERVELRHARHVPERGRPRVAAARVDLRQPNRLVTLT
jgi:Bacterial Ig-like domain (group 1)